MGRRASRIGPKPEDLEKQKIPAGGIIDMNYKFFINTNCSYFPCHDLPEWKSCLFAGARFICSIAEEILSSRKALRTAHPALFPIVKKDMTMSWEW